ncbi:MAG: DNA topoisomerase (ATP-hydrolyzing) subunit B [Candidatus Mcinerneyibacterium aminivorans]|uniref:DNA gyrase subunit B n=1 Tax=Candidatus Mcinerneyibacterium aminivorans TaxID=2703815 RepID=A0A5D0MCY0_9BACT|nr:MAG: DNA topoisomerase (ATP-hydrolyzing) subunit B [Candidatus Mcinerneyibacterium aminivorans]
MLTKYDASNIKVLKGLEGVRKRPAMYIGSTDSKGLHHLVNEVVDNSIDEAMAGRCDKIEIQINPDNSVKISDNGAGIPVDQHDVYKDKSALEVVMTMLHAGGKFDKDTYKVSGGLHGVGVSVVNALSEYLIAYVYKNGKEYMQRFEKGEKVSELKEIGETSKTGTTIHFKPDPEIFTETEFDFDVLAKRARELAFLNAGIRLILDDKRSGEVSNFKYKGGVKAFVSYLNKGEDIIFNKPLYIEGVKDDIEIEIALQYIQSVKFNIYSYVNNINTIEGGTHLTGFKSALTKSINKYAKNKNMFNKNDDRLSGSDVREGLTAVISIKVPDPQFEGQTKTKLGNQEVKGIIRSICNDKFSIFFDEHPSTSRSIVKKAQQAQKARKAAQKAKNLARRSSGLGVTSLPGKLADCSSRKPENTELFIVEGNSAGGSAKQGRDRTHQAILPLRGKVLNVFKSSELRALKNTEIKSLITAIGTGYGQTFDMENLRYHKIIIMTDADVDGAHIRTLLLTFFYKMYPELIEQGYVYIAQPPLYKVKRGRKSKYIQTEEELNQFLIENVMEEVEVKLDGKEIEGIKLKKFFDVIISLKNALIKMSTKDMDVKDFRELEEAGLPNYKIFYLYKEGYEYAQDNDELNELIEDAKIEYIQDRNKRRKNKLLLDDISSDDIVEIWDVQELANLSKIENKLQKYSLNLEDYHDERTTPLAEILYNEDNIEVYSLKELFDQIKEIGKKGYSLQRYKGLGEMNPNQLWETTMNPENRVLLRVEMEDALEAVDIFDTLMGSDAKPRKEFIQRNALLVKNLDI